MLVAIYGSSFAQDVGRAMASMEPDLAVRFVGGPAAPVSHSYTAYMLDRNQYEGQVVVMGILASSVRGLRTMTGLTWMFERPCPYTYPRYVITDGTLRAIWPSIRTLPDMRGAESDEARWSSFTKDLQRWDDYYDPVLFREGLLDSSIIARLARRAWGQRHEKRLTDDVHDSSGFKLDTSTKTLLRAIVSEFIREVRGDGRIPVALLLEDQGYGGHLVALLTPLLREECVWTVSSDSIVSASDPKNFVPDGHFTESATRQVSEVTMRVIASAIRARKRSDNGGCPPEVELSLTHVPTDRGLP